MNKRMVLFVLLSILSLTTACGSNSNEHIHNYSESYSYDSTSHWNECSCGDKTNIDSHTYGSWIIIEEATINKAGSKKQICSVCGYENIVEIPILDHTHNYSSTYSYDSENHWYECGCGDKKDIEIHNIVDKDCTICDYYEFSQGLSLTLLSDNTYEVSSIGTCKDANLIIPYKFNGKSVTSIGSSAFKYFSGLISIEIPNSVTSIGEDAFSGCSRLENVYYEGSIEEWCNITFSNEYSNPMSHASHFYMKNSNNEWNEVTEIEIPNNITIIGNYQFYGFNNVTSMIISNSVTSIRTYAFSRCSSLTSIVIGSGVTSIEDYAFEYCYKLVEVYNLSLLNIPIGSTGKEYVGYYAKVIHASLEESSILTKTLDGYVFMYYDNEYYLVSYEGNDTELILPNDINGYNYKIYDYAFQYCRSLMSIEIPNSVTSIGNSVFSGCISLKYNEYDNAYYLGNDTNPYMVLVEAKSTRIKSCKINENAKIINNNAFEYCNSLTSVTFEGNSQLTSIGDETFYNCSNLTSITIPNSVMNIGDYAFYNCSSLTSIEIPNSITSIGNSAFSGCSSLKYNEYDNGYYLGNDENPYLILVKAKSTDITSIEISNNTRLIYSRAFYNCSSLTSITIPNGVASIGYDAFDRCSNLKYNEYDNGYYLGNDENPYLILVKAKSTDITSIEISNNTRFIHSEAFENCSLTSIIIPNSIISIGDRAFIGCYKLLEVYNLSSLNITKGSRSCGYVGYFAKAIHTTLEEEIDQIKTNDGYVFMYYNGEYYLVSYEGNDTELILPNDINGKSYRIIDGAFYKCSSLISITITEGVTSIGLYAFSECSSLISIEIPNSVTSIGSYAFSGCSSLKNVYYEGSIEDWCNILFDMCNPMLYASHFYMKDSNNEWNEVTEIEIPNTITTIGCYQFEGFNNVTSITIPNSVTSIGSYAFSWCSNLISIKIPNSVTRIEKYAFSNCSSLESITIPNSVTSIGDAVFIYCSSLESITIPNSVISIGSHAFSGCSSLTSMEIPNNVKDIGSAAFSNCSSLESITIPKSVTRIEEYAFLKCSSLTSVYYNGTSSEWNSIRVHSNNSELTNANIYYYSEIKPTDTTNKYWHYNDNNEIVVW